MLRTLIQKTLEQNLTSEEKGKLYAVIIHEGLKECTKISEEALETLPFFV